MKSTAFSKNRHCEENVSLRDIDRKLTLNLIVIFNSFTDISFQSMFLKYFVSLTIFRKNFGIVLRCR